MATLRRRLRNGDTNSSLDAPPEVNIDNQSNREELREIPVSKLQALTGKRRSKRRSGLIFGLGGIFGIFVALFFANQHEVIRLDGLMELNLESLLDVIPASMVRDAKEFSV